MEYICDKKKLCNDILFCDQINFYNANLFVLKFFLMKNSKPYCGKTKKKIVT